jgi:hypothetical protein
MKDLFSEKDPKTIFQVLHPIWVLETGIATAAHRNRAWPRRELHPGFSGGKSIDLYLARTSAARRVRVQCDDMDNAVIYGYWAVGSVAALGAALAFLVW